MDLDSAESSSVAPGAHGPGRPAQRRLSKKSASHDRHGKVFQESDKERTVRAVTPESPSSSGRGAGVSSPNLKSPRSKVAHHQRQAPASVSNTDEEEPLERRRRKSRSRFQKAEGVESEASSNSFFSKTRQRLESFTTNSPSTREAEVNVGSIGFPYVVPSPPPPDLGERRQPIISPPQRTFSPPSSSDGRQSSLGSPFAMNSDSRKILQLMKTTCGRMHGILFYRSSYSDPWASAYCAINVAPGSLVCQVKGDVTLTRTLIPDLRGSRVRTHYDSEAQTTYLSVTTVHDGLSFQLRPPVPETFDSWLAALLCWQPLKPKAFQSNVLKPAPAPTLEKRRSGPKRVLGLADQKKTTIIKVGKMLFWDGSFPTPLLRRTLKGTEGSPGLKDSHASWRPVSCTLHENGDFKLLSEHNSSTIYRISLSRLSRSDVHQLHPSVLARDHCLALYPKFRAADKLNTRPRPCFLAFDSRTPSEAWFVLLRALTMPEIYGPDHSADPSSPVAQPEASKASTSTDMAYRIERTLSVRLTEARFHATSKAKAAQDAGHRPRGNLGMSLLSGGCYAEILFDKDLRARTALRSIEKSAFWAEEFRFDHFPPALSTISIVVKDGNPTEKEWTMVAHESYELAHGEGGLPSAESIEVSSHDTVYGKVEVQLESLEQRRDVEQRWPILDKNGSVIGDLLMKINFQEHVVLMQEEYGLLTNLLLNFSNSLTPQIAQAIGSELKQLSEVLLDIFQVLGSVTEWISNLVEEEIDGIYKDTPPARMRFIGRVYSSDSFDSSENREMFVRDLSRSANNEANLLFRGNSLVTKALDAHMRRLGKDYLEETLGLALRRIVAQDIDCEVDPARLRPYEQRERNWATLISLTSNVWESIAASATDCPSGLRVLFRHIRSCAEDRYGTFIRTVKYTSVSGFLFLRFFCPAILNPELFGLLPERPPERPRRTMTLVAKSLIVLANMAKFGQKEPWMEPMNRFLVTATPSFKAFIDDICSIHSSSTSNTIIEPQNASPMQIVARLPKVYQEGVLSLPFLLDSAKSQAGLVSLWTDCAPANIFEIGVDQCLKDFHEVCTRLHAQSKLCLDDFGLAEKSDQKLKQRWEELLVGQQQSLSGENPFDENMNTGQRISSAESMNQFVSSPPRARPNSARQAVNNTNEDSSMRSPSFTSSSRNGRRIPYPQTTLPDTGTYATNSTNSSTVSLEAVDRVQTRPSPGSREGSTKNRIFELVSLPTRRKARQKGEGTGLEEDEDDV